MQQINDPMFTVFPIIFCIMFVLVLGFIIFIIIKSIGTWSHNNAQPKLTVLAKIVAKRENVSSSTHNDADNFSHSDSSTTYFITFEVESGDRIEFHVSGNEYGLLVEQDNGNLTFQGTRYLGFKRTI